MPTQASLLPTPTASRTDISYKSTSQHMPVMLEDSFDKYSTALESMSRRCEFNTAMRLQLMHTLLDVTCDI